MKKKTPHCHLNIYRTAFYKIQLLKTFNTLEITWNFFSCVKDIHENVSNITFNNEETKAFLLSVVARQGHLRLPLVLCNLIVDVLAREIRQVKEMKDTQLEKERKSSVFVLDMIHDFIYRKL